MPSLCEDLQKCAVCGAVNRFSVLKPVDIDWCDLDMRPGGSLRARVNDTVQECPDCGYAAPDISWAPVNIKEILNYIQNRGLLKMKRFPESVKKFLRAAAVEEFREEIGAAYIVYLNAAWHCEDIKHEEGFSTLVLKLCSLSKGPVGKSFYGLYFGDIIFRPLIQADLLRRIGDFNGAKHSCAAAYEQSKGEFDEEYAQEEVDFCRDTFHFHKRLVKLERRLIEAEDKKAYSMKKVELPPIPEIYDLPEDEDIVLGMGPDPLDEDLRYMYVMSDAESLADSMLEFNPRPIMGYCHWFWAKKKVLLKRRFGLNWKSTAELHPHVCYD